MSIAVLLSMQPQYCELIASGKKTVEVRKTRPKLETPFKVYIYCCKPKQILRYVWGKEDYRGIFPDEELDDKKVFCKIPNGSNPFCSTRYAGKVIGEFVCDDVAKIIKDGSCFIAEGRSEAETNRMARLSCLDFDDMNKYLGEKCGYAWHISNLVIYDQPKELSAFHNFCEKYPSCNDSCEYYAWTVEGGSECMCDTKKPFIRPSQSWRYAEEV